MENNLGSNLKSIPAEFQPQLDLYTIPSSSSWFSWNNIHLNERKALKEFFDGSSFTRSPKYYKEYRDFIINKFREDPSRRLTFTEVRKSLVGDVSLLHKVFNWLEKWGLINFNVDDVAKKEGDNVGGKCEIRVEDGAPVGVRVMGMPNLLKPVSTTSKCGSGIGRGVENGVRFRSLVSYSDVFGEWVKENLLKCGRCGERCDDSGHYRSTEQQESSVICTKCFKNGNYGDNKTAEEFKFIGCTENNGTWTEDEMLLLLESVLKHGDDWELVAQSVKTKSKIDCISKLIQLPFGDFMLGSTLGRPSTSGNICAGNVKEVKLPSSQPQSEETIKIENQSHEQMKDAEQNGDAEYEGPPLKKQCIASSSLLKQVTLMSNMVSPYVTTAAAEAAVTALCEENQCSREIFYDYRDNVTSDTKTLSLASEATRALQVGNSETKEMATLSETQEIFPENNVIPQTLRYRAATATALGTAAARAKSLADHEERAMEHLMATVIEKQMNKLHGKLKLFEDLESIMEKEYILMEELEESITMERISLLQSAYELGISRWRDHSSVKSQVSTVS